MTLFLASVFVALFVSALCSLAEATLLSLTPSQVAELAEKHPRTGRIWQRFKANIDRPIAAILILNTSAHTIGASVAGAQFDEAFGGKWIVLFSLIFTFLMLQYTEILPKTMGVRYNARLAVYLARPLSFLGAFLHPVVRVVHFINRPFEGRRGKEPRNAPTLEELSALAGLARISNLIGRQEERIIKAATRLSLLRADQIMIPAEQVSFLSTDQTLAEAVAAAHLDPHTRFPVIDSGSRDNVVGYVNFKEMIYYMRTNPNDPSLLGIIRPVHFVRPNEQAADLLRVFVEKHVHIAIVKSDEEKTLGLVTLEDIVEELVGELEDEFDRLPRMFHPLSRGTWMVGGGVPIADLGKRIDVKLPDTVGTTSAWLIRQMGGKTPTTNDVYRHPPTGDQPGLEFAVRRTRRGQIFEVAVTRQPTSMPASPVAH